jgi:hypothetical protein
MATIWFTKEGETQIGPSIAERSIDWCVEKLGLKESDRIADLKTRKLTIGSKTPMSNYRGNRFVIIEINDASRQDSSGRSWNTGYYLIDKEPAEVYRILGSPKP